MTRKQRLTQILNYLSQHKKLSIGDLADYFEISQISIRRDIDHLNKAGLLERFHGGVVSIAESNLKYMSLDYRQTQNVLLKKFLGMKASELISDKMTLFLDNSTTVQTMIPLLAKKNELNIITASLDIVRLLENIESIRVTILEGTLDRRYRLFFGGYTDLKKYKIDAAFLGMSGISPDGTLEIDNLTAALKASVAASSKSVYIVADHNKLTFTKGITAVPAQKITKIITDTLPEDWYLFPEYKDRILVFQAPHER